MKRAHVKFLSSRANGAIRVQGIIHNTREKKKRKKENCRYLEFFFKISDIVIYFEIIKNYIFEGEGGGGVRGNRNVIISATPKKLNLIVEKIVSATKTRDEEIKVAIETEKNEREKHGKGSAHISSNNFVDSQIYRAKFHSAPCIPVVLKRSIHFHPFLTSPLLIRDINSH